MSIRIVKELPVPMYRATCQECRSLLEFNKAAVTVASGTFDGKDLFVTFECPVCRFTSSYTPAYRNTL